jgi:AcrR family transcriptional regulator
MGGRVETRQGIDPDLLQRVVDVATARGVSITSLSVDEIATGLGMSRMTLYRKIGSRKALHMALRERGHDPGEETGAAERALDATADLIREVGIASLTLDAVATRARCAVPTIYAQFGGRSGLLMAVFERHSPVLTVRNALEEIQPGDGAGFRRCVSHVYAIIFDTIHREQALLRAMLAEALHDPSSDVGQFIVTRYMPSIGIHILPWVAMHMGRGVIRPLPVMLVAQQLIAPILVHVATRRLVEAAGIVEIPSQAAVCDQLADMFCRAVEIPAIDPSGKERT